METTLIFTTAGPYFCTIALKSGRTALGFPVAGAGTVGAGCVAAGAGWVWAVGARISPNAYKAPTGAATAAAPIRAAKTWFLTKVLGDM
ncbi:hypothetical protein JNW93_15360, partial [Lacticaseibacillus rhamnosus]|uniref:hypothetical protein n=1 Tax=Lacticaseibacillus rhamnosus TaxID=47715 RepID=UPI00194EFB9B